MIANILIVVAGLLIATRLTLIITTDRISEALRMRVISKLGADHWFTYFIHCPWCVGLWLGVAAAVAVWFTAPADWPLTAWWGIPGLSALYAWADGIAGRLHDGGEQ